MNPDNCVFGSHNACIISVLILLTSLFCCYKLSKHDITGQSFPISNIFHKHLEHFFPSYHGQFATYGLLFAKDKSQTAACSLVCCCQVLRGATSSHTHI